MLAVAAAYRVGQEVFHQGPRQAFLVTEHLVGLRVGLQDPALVVDQDERLRDQLEHLAEHVHPVCTRLEKT
jgi:hypothetical protein